MPFHSILSPHPAVSRDGRAPVDPDVLHDLNLDQVVDAVVAGREAYDLKPFFHRPAHDVATVRYRHEVLHDLENTDVARAVSEFAAAMRTMRTNLEQSGKLRYRYQKETWFRDAVEVYCTATGSFADQLARLELTSAGLRAFRDHLANYVRSTAFAQLTAETKDVRERLGMVRYCVHVKGGRVTVSHDHDEADYSAKVLQTFAKFQQGEVAEHLVKLRDQVEMNHVEEQILGLVARLYPDVFGTLDDYCQRHRDYLDPTISAFDREVQFYLAYLSQLRRFTAAGLPVCYPEVTPTATTVAARRGYDIALAGKLVGDGNGESVVCNDFTLEVPERVLVVTGPNQGGKTTFARMVGQLHYLASLGLPVPAEHARLSLPDRIFTHFEREESIQTLRGKLDDELVRIHDVLARATAESVVITNESFSSTTLHDALFLGTQVLRQLLDRGSIAVYVTFVDELASLDVGTVSMVATVDPADPAVRTFRVVRKPADGLAYAAAIAAKYGLTYESLSRRVTR